MGPSDFPNPSGQLASVERESDGIRYWAFLPSSLPPLDEAAALAEVTGLLSEADYLVGQLDGAGQFLPNPDILFYPYLRREAVASTRIEGTRASFEDVVIYDTVREAPPGSDVLDVHNYVLAFEYGLRHIGAGLTHDLLRELHRILLTGARGQAFGRPGEYRFMQAHIGSTALERARFVPPPPEHVYEQLGNLFAYLADESVPVLVQVAWLHYQFEAIHPFMDGNGRIGRLLIPLIIAKRRKLDRSLLYMAPFFERNKLEYIDKLFRVSSHSDWAGWLRFFLGGVVEQATEGSGVTREIVALRQAWNERLASANATANAYRLSDYILGHIAADAKDAARELGVSPPTAYSTLDTLESLGIVREATGRARKRVYVSPELVAIFGSN